MIGKSDEEMCDKYVEEYARENEQMENEKREIAEAADAYMNGVIEDVRFDGVACTISTASTSMMTDLLNSSISSISSSIFVSF